MAINFWQKLKNNKFTLAGGTLGAGVGAVAAEKAFDPMAQSFAQSHADCLNNPNGCDPGGHLQISNPDQSFDSIDYTAAGSPDGSFLYTKEDILNGSDAWQIYWPVVMICAAMAAVSTGIFATLGSFLDEKNQVQDPGVQIQTNPTTSPVLD